MWDLNDALYTAADLREFERRAIGQGIDSDELMRRAGGAALACLRERWPRPARIDVVCGPGNNGGDGYVLARLARLAGVQTLVHRVGEVGSGASAAARARDAYLAAGGVERPFDADRLREAEVVVDALFGIGLSRPIEGVPREAVQAMNACGRPILALDVPSGVQADSGAVLGTAVTATATVSFIAHKRGLFTGPAVDYTGDVLLRSLDLPREVYAGVAPSVMRLAPRSLPALLPRRRRGAHKGEFGHVLVVGGDYGMPGAVRLAAEAALRAGAGRVTVATRPEHVAAVTAARPELMCRGVQTAAELELLLAAATVVVVGPGLGRGEWSRALRDSVLASELPLVVDADALNLFSGTPRPRGNWVLTPHPGEAARLLGSDVMAVQADRFAAVATVARAFDAIAVLKGAGTLVADAAGSMRLCDRGNPGLASAGCGDVLAGVIGGLLAQGLDLRAAAETGVLVHALAADRAARDGERGMLAGDLFAALRATVNPHG
ncbi:MAG TPA: NAD(P)H-hydrate dehydratase [Gammaproteobacteria bacterium]|nr:NAD(P)H-hydrate dehydratase [Gammaproteobacteria bacterium]